MRRHITSLPSRRTLAVACAGSQVQDQRCRPLQSGSIDSHFRFQSAQFRTRIQRCIPHHVAASTATTAIRNSPAAQSVARRGMRPGPSWEPSASWPASTRSRAVIRSEDPQERSPESTIGRSGDESQGSPARFDPLWHRICRPLVLSGRGIAPRCRPDRSGHGCYRAAHGHRACCPRD
jgi:hypothetical protein